MEGVCIVVSAQTWLDKIIAGRIIISRGGLLNQLLVNFSETNAVSSRPGDLVFLHKNNRIKATDTAESVSDPDCILATSC